MYTSVRVDFGRPPLSSSSTSFLSSRNREYHLKTFDRTPLIWRLQAPDQGSTVDFFLFPRLKSIMKGARFADVAAIQERVTAVLRSIPKHAFSDSFKKLYERYQQCVFKDGDYFEG
jgi:hypothetical protein